MAGNKNLSWFPMYVNDWLTDPRVLSLPPTFKGYYVDLLCFQWREGSIPNDSELCRRMLGADWHLWYAVVVLGPTREELVYGDAWPLVNVFFKEDGDIRVNRKLHDIAVEQQQMNARYRDRARQGGLAKARNLAENKEVAASSTTKALLLSRESESESESKSKTIYMSGFYWDDDKGRIWSHASTARARIREKWIERGMSRDEFQRQMRKLNRWLDSRPQKRGPKSNFANRINNWMNNFVDEKERREDET